MGLKSAGTIIGSIALNAGKVAATATKATSDAALTAIDVLQANITKATGRAKANPVKTAAIAGASTAIVVAGGVAGGIVTRRRRDFHFAGRTSSGPAKVFNIKDEAGTPVRVLSIGGVYQSATYLEEDTKYLLPFAYYRAFDIVFQEGIAHDRLLMLGGGGCTFPKHVLAEDATTCIDVIEPDAAVISIAREYFFLDDAISQFDGEGTRLHVINDDGVHFLHRRAELAKAEDHKAAPPVFEIMTSVARTVEKFVPTMKANEDVPLRYDAIINDAFKGKRPVASLLTHDALMDAKVCLNEGGLYLINVADPGKNDIYLRQIMSWLSSCFTSVHVIPCPDKQFGAKECCLLVATDGDYSFVGESQVQMSDVADAEEDETEAPETPEE